MVIFIITMRMIRNARNSQKKNKNIIRRHRMEHEEHTLLMIHRNRINLKRKKEILE